LVYRNRDGGPPYCGHLLVAALKTRQQGNTVRLFGNLRVRWVNAIISEVACGEETYHIGNHNLAAAVVRDQVTELLRHIERTGLVVSGRHEGRYHNDGAWSGPHNIVDHGFESRSRVPSVDIPVTIVRAGVKENKIRLHRLHFLIGLVDFGNNPPRMS
jgi:hypothetical protein